MRRILFLVFFGLGGAAILVSLGVWQVQRLNWKQEILARIDARIAEAPVALPANPDPASHQYLPVEVQGIIQPELQKVLVSIKGQGPGYRIIHPFLLADGRNVLLDRGFIPVAEGERPIGAPTDVVSVIGNLHWPDEIDRFTPEPDLTANLWFARDVPGLAARLRTEPVLIVAAKTSEQDGPVAPLPVDSSVIPNDHLQYAITWFSLALVWVGMTAYFLRRQRRQAESANE